MGCIVDAMHSGVPICEFYPVKAARALFKPPECGEGLIEHLHQDRAIHIVVANQDHSLCRVTCVHVSDGIGSAGDQVL